MFFMLRGTGCAISSCPECSSPEQCGREPLQRPSSWHMRVELPIRVRFPRQLYRTTEPTVYLSPEIWACGGEPGCPQETTARDRWDSFSHEGTAWGTRSEADRAGTRQSPACLRLLPGFLAAQSPHICPRVV